uniref:SPK domain-containing protein n=1 Tax=Caenorhabditis tropicalis TaxID=1561998 RepID=A0A1I7TUC7_9PELO
MRVIAEGTDEYNAEREEGRDWFYSLSPIEKFRHVCKVMFIKEEFTRQDDDPFTEEVIQWFEEERDNLWQAVLNNCKNRYDASAAELSSCLRLSMTELNKRLFKIKPELLDSYQRNETEWRAMNWFRQTCEVVGVTEARFEMMKTNTKLVEMIVKCAREIALNHGFSEVVNDKWKHDPKLEANEFSEDLFRAVFRRVLQTIDLRQDLTRMQLELFRLFGGLIHWKKEDIDEMEKNPEIVEIVIQATTNQSFTFEKEPISDVRFDSAWRTIYESCLHRSGPAVEELRGRMRRSAADYFKTKHGNNPNFEKLRRKNEIEWKTSVWFKESCSRLLITNDRYKMMKTNPEMVKMIGKCARKTALKHGFSEVINNEEKRDPKLADREFVIALFRAIPNRCLKYLDPLETEFAEHFIESRKLWIEQLKVSEEEKKSLMEYLIYLQKEIDEKDPFVVHNGQKMRASKVDLKKFDFDEDDNGEIKVIDRKMKNKDPKSLEEGSEEEIDEESDEETDEDSDDDSEEESEEEEEEGEGSVISSMLGRLGL